MSKNNEGRYGALKYNDNQKLEDEILNVVNSIPPIIEVRGGVETFNIVNGGTSGTIDVEFSKIGNMVFAKLEVINFTGNNTSANIIISKPLGSSFRPIQPQESILSPVTINNAIAFEVYVTINSIGNFIIKTPLTWTGFCSLGFAGPVVITYFGQ